MAASIKISNKPWSSYTESDYTLQQWHTACLIHLHDGSLISKAFCKLPVKTPDGIVNKNGVFAAAAALAGARTALKAPIAQKAMAARKLMTLYQQIGAKPPASLFSLGHSMDIDIFLEHHGIKGQRWGIRNEKDKQIHREKKAKKFEAKAEKHQKTIDALNRVTPSPFHTRQDINAQIRALSELQRRQLKNAKATRQGKFRLTDPQKQVIAVTVGAAFIAAYIASVNAETKRTTFNPNGRNYRRFGGSAKGFAPPPPSQNQSAKDFIKSQRDVQMYSLKRMHAEGKMDAEQFANFSKKLNDRFDRKLVGV